MSRIRVKILKLCQKRHCKALIFLLLSYHTLVSYVVNSSMLSEQSHLKSQQNTAVQTDLRLSNENLLILSSYRTVGLF